MGVENETNCTYSTLRARFSGKNSRSRIVSFIKAFRFIKGPKTIKKMKQWRRSNNVTYIEIFRYIDVRKTKLLVYTCQQCDFLYQQ